MVLPEAGSPHPEHDCPLCAASTEGIWQNVDGAAFFRCPLCDLIFRHPSSRPALPEERAHYRQHENDPSDPGYRAFLDRCFGPLTSKLAPDDRGLDFGCGPGPAISVMAAERGFTVDNWDPAFFPDQSQLRSPYDFLISTEVLEHLHHPGETLTRMFSLVRPGGWLAVMTGVYRDDRPWPEWNYWRDLTHVCIYTPATMDWIARDFDCAENEAPHPNVRLWRKAP